VQLLTEVEWDILSVVNTTDLQEGSVDVLGGHASLVTENESLLVQSSTNKISIRNGK
jgi:hypothetical protein